MRENVNIIFIVVWQNIYKQIVWKGCKMEKWRKTREVVSLGNMATSFVNSDSCCFVFFKKKKTGNEIERFYKCAVSAKVVLTVQKMPKKTF